jgi:hypothetical protein
MYLLQIVAFESIGTPFIDVLEPIASSPDAWKHTLAIFARVAIFILGSMVFSFCSYLLVERPGVLLGKFCIDQLEGMFVSAPRKEAAAGTSDETLERKDPVGADTPLRSESKPDLDGSTSARSSPQSEELHFIDIEKEATPDPNDPTSVRSLPSA